MNKLLSMLSIIIGYNLLYLNHNMVLKIISRSQDDHANIPAVFAINEFLKAKLIVSTELRARSHYFLKSMPYILQYNN